MVSELIENCDHLLFEFGYHTELGEPEIAYAFKQHRLDEIKKDDLVYLIDQYISTLEQFKKEAING